MDVSLIFDALSYTGKPDLSVYGFSKIHIISRNADGTTTLTQAGITAAVAAILLTDSTPVICLDIETMPYDIRKSTPAQVDTTLTFLSQVMGWVRAAAPTSKVGFYSISPISDYWTTNMYNTAFHRQENSWWKGYTAKANSDYAAWQTANSYLSNFAATTDFVAPAFYTFYDLFEAGTDGAVPDVYNGWKDAALLTINDARRYKKPIYPFIWPQFHEGGTYKDNRYLPEDYWRAQLKWTQLNADGVIIWGWGGFLNETWDTNVSTSGWWAATLAACALIH